MNEDGEVMAMLLEEDDNCIVVFQGYDASESNQFLSPSAEFPQVKSIDNDSETCKV